jgi:hypothetical protein
LPDSPRGLEGLRVIIPFRPRAREHQLSFLS